MSLAHILSQESQLSQYYEEEKEKIERKQIISKSKEPVDKALLRKGLHHLGITADGAHHAYLKLDISGHDLLSINGDINISCNQLSTLKPLGELKHLVNLNAAYNQLHKMFDFTPPANLQNVDYSNNFFVKIEGVHKHRYLKSLVLDNNQITKISGLEKNICLMNLSIRSNNIEKMENLDDLLIESLNLAENRIKKIEGLSTLGQLSQLDLSRNKIRKLKGLKDCDYLRFLDLSGNQISKVKQLVYIEDLQMITEFDLSFNPIQCKKYYRFQVLYRISQLRKLDGVKIIAQEKVKAENLHGLDLEDKTTIFKTLLPEEQFVDRRIKTFEDIDPESDSSAEEKLDQDMELLSGEPQQTSQRDSLPDESEQD